MQELAITEDEAKEISDAFAKVARHYEAFQKKYSQKYLDMIGLGKALAHVYGPRAVMLWQRSHAAAPARARPAAPPPQPQRTNATAEVIRPATFARPRADQAPDLPPTLDNTALPPQGDIVDIPANFDPNKLKLPKDNGQPPATTLPPTG